VNVFFGSDNATLASDGQSCESEIASHLMKSVRAVEDALFDGRNN
jgi:hypothetical protein